MSSLRIAIFGCGRMGHERARCAHQLGASIVAAYDSDRERAEALAAEYGGHAGATQEEYVWSGVDAVFFCTPPNCREAPALSAIAAGVAFLAEKPVGLSHGAAERVLAALDRTPVVNVVGYMNRCRASIAHARSVLESCEFLGLAGYWVCKKYSVPWWMDEGASGGPLNEQATHVFDLSRLFGGEIASVQALSAERGEAAGQSLGSAVALRFRSGKIGTIFYSCESSVKDIGLHLFTDRGGLVFSGWDFQMTGNTIDGVLPTVQGEDVFLAETDQFLRAVRSSRRDMVACDWREAMRTQAVVDSARRAMATEMVGAAG